MLINVKMSTFVGIFTFMSGISLTLIVGGTLYIGPEKDFFLSIKL